MSYFTCTERSCNAKASDFLCLRLRLRLRHRLHLCPCLRLCLHLYLRLQFGLHLGLYHYFCLCPPLFLTLHIAINEPSLYTRAPKAFTQTNKKVKSFNNYLLTFRQTLARPFQLCVEKILANIVS
jgi:hypothetical protein